MTTAEWRAVFKRLAEMAWEADSIRDLWKSMYNESREGSPANYIVDIRDREKP